MTFHPHQRRQILDIQHPINGMIPIISTRRNRNPNSPRERLVTRQPTPQLVHILHRPQLMHPKTNNNKHLHQ
jgi:hypothetical protein